MVAPGQTDFRAEYHGNLDNATRWGSNWPWLNMLRCGSSAMGTQEFLRNNFTWGPGETYFDYFDDRGIPKKSGPVLNGALHYFNFPRPRHYDAQDYILGWTGTGAIKFFGGNYASLTPLENTGATLTGSPGGYVISGTDVRFKFHLTWGNPAFADAFWVWVADATYSNMGTPYLIMASHEEAYSQGKLCNPDYVNYIKYINPRIIRAMQVNEWESTCVAPFTCRPRVDGIEWFGQVFPQSLFVGEIKSDDGGHTYYTDSPKPSGLDDTIQPHETFWGYIKVSQGENNPYLNIAGRGAKKIVGHAWYMGWGNTTEISGSSNGDVWTFHYDEFFDAYVAVPGAPHGGGYPIDAQIALANEVGCGWWYNFPVYTGVKEAGLIATYVANNLNHNTGTVGLFEYANEVWNFAGPYWGFSYTQALGDQRAGNGWGGGKSLIQAMLMPEVERAWEETGRSRNDLKIAHMGQASKSYDFVRFITGGYLQGGPYEHLIGEELKCVDCIGIAPYVGSTYFADYPHAWGNKAQHQPLCDLADTYAEGDTEAKRQVLETLDNDLRERTAGGQGGGNDANYSLRRYREAIGGVPESGFYPWLSAVCQQLNAQTMEVDGRHVTVWNYEGRPSALGAPNVEVLIEKGWPEPDAVKYGVTWSVVADGGAAISNPGLFGQLLTDWKNSDLMRTAHYQYVRDFMAFDDCEVQAGFVEGAVNGYSPFTEQVYLYSPFLTYTDTFYGPTENGYLGFKDWNDTPILPVYIHERTKVLQARQTITGFTVTAGTAPTNGATLTITKTPDPRWPSATGGVLATITFPPGSTSGIVTYLNPSITRINPGDSLSIAETGEADPTFQQVTWSVLSTPLPDLFAPPVELPDQVINLDFATGVFLWNGTTYNSLSEWMSASGATYTRASEITVVGPDGNPYTAPANELAINHRWNGTAWAPSGFVDDGTGVLSIPTGLMGGTPSYAVSVHRLEPGLWDPVVPYVISLHAFLRFAIGSRAGETAKYLFINWLEADTSLNVDGQVPFKVVGTVMTDVGTYGMASVNGDDPVGSGQWNWGPPPEMATIQINGEFRALAKSDTQLDHAGVKSLSAWEEEGGELPETSPLADIVSPLELNFTTTQTIPQDFVDSTATATTAPEVTTVIMLTKQRGDSTVNFGGITFPAGELTGNFWEWTEASMWNSELATFLPGDKLIVASVAPENTTLRGASWSLATTELPVINNPTIPFSADRTIRVNFAGSFATALLPPTSQTVLNIEKHRDSSAVTIGQITFEPGSTNGVFSSLDPDQARIMPGDSFVLTGPDVTSTALRGVTWLLATNAYLPPASGDPISFPGDPAMAQIFGLWIWDGEKWAAARGHPLTM